MPHKDFDALRRDLEREHDPLTFTLCGELFTTVTSPRLGDTFDLMDAPEPLGETEEQAVRALCRFIRKMLRDEDRPRWDGVLFKLGPEHGRLIVEIGLELVEQYTNRPTVPPSESSDGRPSTGERSSGQPDEKPSTAASTP